jgi:anti-sigma factor RsiW
MTARTGSSAATPAPIDCETAVRRLWDFLDGRLAAMAHAEVEAHLATCEHCPAHFEFARKMRAELSASHAFGLADNEEARLRERVRSALRRVTKLGPEGR